jgi:hypothetical protein
VAKSGKKVAKSEKKLKSLEPVTNELNLQVVR